MPNLDGALSMFGTDIVARSDVYDNRPQQNHQSAARMKRMASGEAQIISRHLLDVLRCPAGRGRLEQRGDHLVCRSCGLAYPVRDGIPVMLLEEAMLPPGVSSTAEIRCVGEPRSDPAAS